GRRTGNLGGGQNVAFDASGRQLVVQAESLSRGLVSENHPRTARTSRLLVQLPDQPRAPPRSITYRAGHRRIAILGNFQQHRFVVQIASHYDKLSHGQCSCARSRETFVTKLELSQKPTRRSNWPLSLAT